MQHLCLSAFPNLSLPESGRDKKESKDTETVSLSSIIIPDHIISRKVKA